MKISVALCKVPAYHRPQVRQTVRHLFESLEFNVGKTARVLVKPNLVVPGNCLATTHPEIVRGVCEYLLESGAIVTVGDSPAFGTTRKVASTIGLETTLRGLPVKIITLGSPVPVVLPCRIRAGISRHAMEADLIINIPKLKAHSQMRITCAVKNLFGCISGFRKALSHCRYGDVSNMFESLILEIHQFLPRQFCVVDAVTAMDRTGPRTGDPFPMQVMGASESPAALDTAVYSILGLKPEQVPLWSESRKRMLPGSFLEELRFTLDRPKQLEVAGFRIPKRLIPVTFHPWRLLVGRIRSLLTRM
ncbi:MAG TPA: DUF362 domain-containing protein [Thermodesulfobacteriaceae bacterium]|nr:DUF362 domain-containing protein [Thermodesulfobacteriaceae bacterium]